jgi:putative transposase
VVDNGPEFISNAVDAWAYARGIKLQFIRPGRPVDNCYMESFNGKFRNGAAFDGFFSFHDTWPQTRPVTTAPRP